MALIKCAECHKEVSDKAKHCPHCGCPVNSNRYAVIKIISICVGLLIVIGIIFAVSKQSYKEKETKVVVDSFEESGKYPQRPNTYSELEHILQQYNPCSPGCRLDLYDALNEDRVKGVPFKETKVYRDWNNYYKFNLTPIY